MGNVIVVGSGISGMTAAIRCAGQGVKVTLISPFPSERSQSVMAAGGINAVLRDCDPGDSVACHVEDTLKGGSYLAGSKAVTGLCENAENIIEYLEKLGTVFSIDKSGKLIRRSFGGQSYRRTYYCGSSTGKQIVSALVMEARRLEAAGMIERRLWSCFHSALIRDGVCYGVLIYDESTQGLEALYGDSVIIATGGQNSLFGKTTGSTQCDGYVAGKLFMQGAELKNLEFIQYHPTTIDIFQKRMLISEAVRGEGGRLFYEESGKKVYFMEEKFGAKGNLVTRDIMSRSIYETGRDVYLDISFMNKERINEKIPEVRDLCLKYRGIDISKEPIPVAPCVHFFMGGLAVHMNHETNIRSLYAIGECASMYHGANRLGGNSLLSAIYSGMVAADDISKNPKPKEDIDFSLEIEEEKEKLKQRMETRSKFPVMYIRDMLAETMNKSMGIVRTEAELDKGLSNIDYYLSIAEKLRYDNSVLAYFNYSLVGILNIAKASVFSAKARKESRGAHYRSDYPDSKDADAYASIISYNNGDFKIRLDKEKLYES